MSKFIERDAEEFGLHVRQGGWRLALLVARSVQPETGGRPRTGAIKPVSTKVSATEFARQASTSKDRVMRYLKAWDKAAAKGVVPPSSELRPGQDIPLDGIAAQHPWSKFYDARQTPAAKAKTASTILEEHAAEVLELLTEDARRAVREAAAPRSTFEGPTATRQQRDRAARSSLNEAQRDRIDADDMERFGEPAVTTCDSCGRDDVTGPHTVTDRPGSQPCTGSPMPVPEPERIRPVPVQHPSEPFGPDDTEIATRKTLSELRDALIALRRAERYATPVTFNDDQQTRITLVMHDIQTALQRFSDAYWSHTPETNEQLPTPRRRRRSSN